MRFPEILARSGEGDTHRYELDIAEELVWFRGHFPDFPVLPGVVQLRWAVELCREEFGFGDGPHEVRRLKFKSIIVPPSNVELTITRTGDAEAVFAFRDQNTEYSQGKLIFAGVEQ